MNVFFAHSLKTYIQYIQNSVMNSYTNRPYSSGDEIKIVPMLIEVFNGWPNFDIPCEPIDHWRWKFLDNPYGKKNIAISLDDDKIIGCIHGVFRYLKIKNKTYLTSSGADAGVLNEYRKSGIFNEIKKIQSELSSSINLESFFSVSANPIMIDTYKRRGHPFFPHKIFEFIWIKDVDLHLKYNKSSKSWLLSTGIRAIQEFSKLRYGEINDSISKYNIIEVTSFGDEIVPFWERIEDNYDFIIVQNKEYLNWRYCDPRGGIYKILQIRKEDKCIGFTILRINRLKGEYPVGTFVDLLCFPGNHQAVQNLISAGMKHFEENKVNYVSFMVVKNHPYEKILYQNGFIQNQKQWEYMFENPFVPENAIENIRKMKPSKIHVSYGDHDWI